MWVTISTKVPFALKQCRSQNFSVFPLLRTEGVDLVSLFWYSALNVVVD